MKQNIRMMADSSRRGRLRKSQDGIGLCQDVSGRNQGHLQDGEESSQRKLSGSQMTKGFQSG
jgi:hypothetical protein